MESYVFELAPGVEIGRGKAPVFIAGPCVIESEEMALEVATGLAGMASRLDVRLVFKSSFDKANRSSVRSFRGPGIDEGLRILGLVRERTGLPILTDVHEPAQAAAAAEVADVLQVPAFLCRQTDLLMACGRTGRAVNIKKGQFMAPEDMANAVTKMAETGNRRVSVTERGTSFGYHDLVVDMRGLAVMRRFAPVIFDATHSLQRPGGLGDATDGAREFAHHLARAAAAAGVDGFFAEVHPDPLRARSDARTQLRLDELERLVRETLAIISALAALDGAVEAAR
jgi:2-dehydro-3-deoxyphosphooctonate aldolase (KDO 8-P synthase)